MNFRQVLIRVITFLGGIYFFLEFVLPEEFLGFKLSQYNSAITNGITAVGAMALGLGLFNLLSVHGSKIIYRRSGWFESLALLVGLTAMASFTWLDWRATAAGPESLREIYMLREFARKIQSDHVENKTVPIPAVERNKLLSEQTVQVLGKLESNLPELDKATFVGNSDEFLALHLAQQTIQTRLLEARKAVSALKIKEVKKEKDLEPNLALASALGGLASARLDYLNLAHRKSSIKRWYTFLYEGFFVALGAAMFSLLGFYIAGAAYRAFRVKSAESALMMVAALLVMLGQIPFGIWLWDGFPEIRLWLLSQLNTAAFRAIKIGAAVAALIMALRMWLSIESGSFSRRTP